MEPWLRGDLPYPPTPRKLAYLFRVINALYFGDKLPRPRFVVEPTDLGVACTNGRYLLVDPRYDWSYATLSATVAHEMIHIWQVANGKPWDHGPVFRKHAARLQSIIRSPV